MPGQANNVDWGTILQLSLLLMALPAQYIIMNYSSTTPHQSQKALKQLMTSAQKLGSEFLSVESWQKWCINMIRSLHTIRGHKWSQGVPSTTKNKKGESPAIEVWRKIDADGYFATSASVRSPRPVDVKYRVGEVVTHKRWGYRGVIVGWDGLARAPSDWLNKNHPKGMEGWRTQPNYAILVDSRDRSPPQITYVPQENIQLTPKMKIKHPDIDDYFDEYDGSRYIMRPGLKELYPDD